MIYDLSITQHMWINLIIGITKFGKKREEVLKDVILTTILLNFQNLKKEKDSLTEYNSPSF